MGGRTNGGGNVAKGAGFAAAKGAALIGLAVVIGIVLLQVVDDGSDGPAASSPDETETTTTTAAPDDGEDTDETTPDTSAAELSPEQLTVLVLNGGAQQGAARAMSDALKQVGYTNQGEPSDWPDRDQTGNVVLCRAELTREAAALAVAVGSATVEDFPDPAPPGADEFNCVVVVGAAAG
jgi:hypothetical protein